MPSTSDMKADIIAAMSSVIGAPEDSAKQEAFAEAMATALQTIIGKMVVTGQVVVVSAPGTYPITGGAVT